MLGFYRYFDTPPQIFHQIRKITISCSYTFMKWKYGEISEKCERGCQNTCKKGGQRRERKDAARGYALVARKINEIAREND